MPPTTNHYATPDPSRRRSRRLDPDDVSSEGSATTTTSTTSTPYEHDERDSRARHGLSRSLVQNMVVGVTEGYSKTLEINGTGYRVVARGSDLEFALGYSHPILVKAPEGITFAVESPTRFSVSGIDKQLVGEVAANIRKLRKPDPYKAKGVRYEGEHIRRKVGKAGK